MNLPIRRNGITTWRRRLECSAVTRHHTQVGCAGIRSAFYPTRKVRCAQVSQVDASQVGAGRRDRAARCGGDFRCGSVGDRLNASRTCSR